MPDLIDCRICGKRHDNRLSCNEASMLERLIDAVRAAQETGDLREMLIRAIVVRR